MFPVKFTELQIGNKTIQKLNIIQGKIHGTSVKREVHVNAWGSDSCMDLRKKHYPKLHNTALLLKQSLGAYLLRSHNLDNWIIQCI